MRLGTGSRRLRALGGVMVCGLMMACGAALPQAASAATPPPPHIMVIMMENTDYSQAIGAATMPYLNELAHQYEGFTESYGWSYPSLPNYLELAAGTNFGITEDCDPYPSDTGCVNLSHELFADQLEAAGITWKAYYQDDPYGCDNNPSDFFTGNYDVEHNAYVYFADFAEQCKHLSNFTPLLSDLASAHAPDYAFVTPDLDNDGGDNGTMSSGDTWLSTELPQIMATPWYQDGGQIVIMYDTGYGDSGGVNGSSGGRIPPILVVSAHTRGKGLNPSPLNTAGVLRSLDHAYGLPYLGDAADPNNGGLDNALVAGRPTGPAAGALYEGAVVTPGPLTPGIETVPGTLAFNGVYRYPDGTSVEVGENSSGEGVIDTSGGGAIAVPGTSNLESVSCPTATTCWAAGLASTGSDQAALVKVVGGQPKSVTRVAAFYGLYGIACPTASTCEAVGYDTSDIADAVTTITNGVPGAPAEVSGGGEWLNAISCPTAGQCYATGLVNYIAAIVPIDDGVPQQPIDYPHAWYANGIDCPSVGNCVVAGEIGNAGEGMVATLVGGRHGTVTLVPGTEYLYGVGCTPDGSCLLAGASQVGPTGYSHGVLLDRDSRGDLGAVVSAPAANGLGQVACGVRLNTCLSVGAA